MTVIEAPSTVLEMDTEFMDDLSESLHCEIQDCEFSAKFIMSHPVHCDVMICQRCKDEALTAIEWIKKHLETHQGHDGKIFCTMCKQTFHHTELHVSEI